ncbi:Tll0287-like domain-containing protein [Congregibacter sp.]|uniref:Tll0287-like domain-containing protein n=1 Tax=Congregibacter sp. TaxID=2744308 RepID=UPI003F6C3CF1
MIKFRSPAALLFAGLLALSLGTAHAQTPHLDQSALERGKEIALLAKRELGGQLQQAMASGGPAVAVEFCNENALPITTAVSENTGARVSRVSDHPRNPDNRAEENELAYIARAKLLLAANEPLSPLMTDKGDHKVGFYPIVTSGLCLQCHGQEGTDISADTLEIIDARYPNDEATGYGLKELRGIFVVSMQKR